MKPLFIAEMELALCPKAIVLLGVRPHAIDAQKVARRRFAEVIEGKRADTTAASGTVSPPLWSIISNIEARGIVRQSARRLSVSVLSDSLVRVNEDRAIRPISTCRPLAQMRTRRSPGTGLRGNN